MANNTSPHILNTSATLLGFCLIVITSLHISKSIIAVLLTLSSIFSFISIKTNNTKKEKSFENIADYFFIISLLGILIIILLITLNYIK